MKQAGLFPHPPKPPRVAEPPFRDFAPFDEWDLVRMTPDPTYVPPGELRIEGLDDPKIAGDMDGKL